MPHYRPDIRGRVEQGGAGLRGEELSWRHERLDQLRIRPAMIQRSCGLVYQGTRQSRVSDTQRSTAKSTRATTPELLAYDLEQILR